MENKYYTPEIEEFHVGFELEWSEFGRKNWTWITIDKHDLIELFNGEEKIEHYRVKYLDQEDIESLGWESDFDSPGRYEYKDYMLYNFNNSNIFTIKQKKCFVKHGEGFVSFDVLFEGEIKNKSELKRLMKQARIL